MKSGTPPSSGGTFDLKATSCSSNRRGRRASCSQGRPTFAGSCGNEKDGRRVDCALKGGKIKCPSTRVRRAQRRGRRMKSTRSGIVRPSRGSWPPAQPHRSRMPRNSATPGDCGDAASAQAERLCRAARPLRRRRLRQSSDAADRAVPRTAGTGQGAQRQSSADRRAVQGAASRGRFAWSDATASVEYAGSLEATRRFAAWRKTQLAGLARTALAQGWVERATIDAMAADFDVWGERADAFSATTWCEAIGWADR